MDFAGKIKGAAAKQFYNYLKKDPDINIAEAADWLIKFGGSGAELHTAVKKAISDPNNNWYKPIGSLWTDTDSSAANRKLGSNIADFVTGSGLHGKELSKADVSVNIYAVLAAQRTGKTVELRR